MSTAGMFYSFQSTYLYKVRRIRLADRSLQREFQPTYLYKVRRNRRQAEIIPQSFNPRTYIRYDADGDVAFVRLVRFQSTYLYKVRRIGSAYIRARKDVSIHVPI